MKIKRVVKDAMYAKCYGCSWRKFKKLVRYSPDENISRIPARKLKALWNSIK